MRKVLNDRLFKLCLVFNKLKFESIRHFNRQIASFKFKQAFYYLFFFLTGENQVLPINMIGAGNICIIPCENKMSVMLKEEFDTSKFSNWRVVLENRVIRICDYCAGPVELVFQQAPVQ